MWNNTDIHYPIFLWINKDALKLYVYLYYNNNLQLHPQFHTESLIFHQSGSTKVSLKSKY